MILIALPLTHVFSISLYTSICYKFNIKTTEKEDIHLKLNCLFQKSSDFWFFFDQIKLQ
jgi:hypothetical protein